MTEKKACLYRTATAAISCAIFQEGEIVGVQYDRTETTGTIWFKVTSIRGDSTFYPEHHLRNFVL